MTTAKLFLNGQSQAVRLPKEFRFNGDEVGIKKVGSAIMIFEPNSAFANFMSLPPMDDDVLEAIQTARQNDFPQEREFFD